VSRGAIANAVVLVLRLVVGAILIAAGVSKAGHAAEFAAQIAAFRLVPEAVIAPMAVELPYIEIIVGVLLIAGAFTRLAAWVAVLLLATFDVAIASAVVRGMSVSCGCFGPNDKTVTTWAEVARDAVFVLLALAVALRPPGMLAIDRRIAKP
jgi:uncharacterized membrane protein YphA (DoxX/SURF4 family)